MTTLQYLKQYAYYYIYAIVITLVLSVGLSHAATQVSSTQQQILRPVIVIDAGHGGIDGGTSSANGTSESQINLEISLRLEALLALLGYDTAMVRTTDTAVATEGETVRQQKQSDLRNRAALANSYTNAILVSIHQNHFSQSRYWGPQVFHADTAASEALAQALQESLNDALAPQSNRTCKTADGVWLMQHVDCPAILVECGFLSNPTEEANLRTPQYQKKLCSILAATLATHVESETVS